MYDDYNRIPVPTAPLSADLLAAMPESYRTQHADYLAAVKLLNDADDVLAAAEDAEADHKAEIIAAAKAGKKIPAPIPAEVFAVKIAAAREHRKEAYRTARHAAAALDDRLIVTADSPDDAPGFAAARYTAMRLADIIAAERTAIEAGRAATATRDVVLQELQHLLIVQEVGADTDRPGTVRFASKARNAVRLFNSATSDPHWITTQHQPSDAEAYEALSHSTDLAHKALFILAPTLAGEDVPERVRELQAATARENAKTGRNKAALLRRMNTGDLTGHAF